MVNKALVCLILTVLLCSTNSAIVPRIAQAAGEATIYVVPTITDDKILPTSSISSGYISNQISIAASPSEFEPASFVVRANQN
ncbi:MAG: hypothetical protein GY845_02095, partial [Planctomycetes bacterium]|nr:hypothetical protein [Planctomycetota bacterium]